MCSCASNGHRLHLMFGSGMDIWCSTLWRGRVTRCLQDSWKWQVKCSNCCVAGMHSVRSQFESRWWHCWTNITQFYYGVFRSWGGTTSFWVIRQITKFKISFRSSSPVFLNADFKCFGHYIILHESKMDKDSPLSSDTFLPSCIAAEFISVLISIVSSLLQNCQFLCSKLKFVYWQQ